MSALHRVLYRSCSCAGSLTLVSALCFFSAGFASAQVEEDAASPEATSTTPYALLQYATLTGSGNTLYATMVPVLTSSGSTVYKNLTLLFDIDPSGNLTVATGYPKSVPAPTPIISNFKAGKYVGPSTLYGGNMFINVSGPGLTSGGATEWTIASATGAAPCTFPDSASWWVGPLSSSPLYTRIKAAGITSTAWSYGTAGSECETSYNNIAWYPNTLIGISQVGNSLTIASFTDSTHKDHNEPVDQVTYTLVQ